MELFYPLGLFLFTLLICFSAFFSAAESSLFSLRQARLEQLKDQGAPVARVISNLLARPRRLIMSILIGNELVNFGASAIATSLILSWLGETRKWVAVLIMTPILLIFGEITPKTLGLMRPEGVSRLVARPMAFLAWVFTPYRWILRQASDRLLWVLGSRIRAPENIIMEEEFRSLVDMGHLEGEIEEEERRMIHRVFEFGERVVSDIMVPRPDLFLLSYNLELPEILEAVKKNPFSRVPVYRNQPDNIVGILYTKDLLALVRRPSPADRGGQRLPLREPYFIPPSKRVDDLFQDFQQKRTHMALVVDEFGHLAGLVTLEDVLKALFGRKAVAAPRDLETLEDGSYLVSAGMPIDDVGLALGLPLPRGPADTLGGLVMDLLGRLPRIGEEVRWDGLTLTVTEMLGRRILKVRVKVLAEATGT